MLIDAAFPGGNVQVHRIEDDHIHFGPDNRDSSAGWFYWCFRVRGQAGRTLHFHPCRKNLLTSHSPAVSTDAGRTWSWAGRACVGESDAFTLTIPHGADDWRVCMTIPYTQEHLQAFVDQHAGRWIIDTLCHTARGSAVPIWRIGQPAEKASHRVFIIARHHCCESMASYLIEGLIDAALRDDELGQWWQQHVSLTVVPFADWDGVAAGDQGKHRDPRDHNRDYDSQPIYPQTPAIQKEVLRLAQRKLDAAFDMHCPWIHSRHSEEIYMVGQNDPRHWAQQQTLAVHLADAATGPLPYDPQDNIPYGQAWNIAKNYAGGCSFSSWTAKQPGVAMCTSMEIPYALSRGQIMTAENVRTFGSQMAMALRPYLANPVAS